MDEELAPFQLHKNVFTSYNTGAAAEACKGWQPRGRGSAKLLHLLPTRLQGCLADCSPTFSWRSESIINSVKRGESYMLKLVCRHCLPLLLYSNKAHVRAVPDVQGKLVCWWGRACTMHLP